MIQNLLKYKITYGQIATHFNGVAIERSHERVKYHIFSREKNYTFYFFRDSRTKELNCWNLESLSCFTPEQLIYFISPSNDSEYVLDLIIKISKIENGEQFFDLSSEMNVTTITNRGLKLVEVTEENSNLIPAEINPNIILTKPFLNKVFLREGKVCFPLASNGKIMNLAFLDEQELNSNPGSFQGWLLPSTNKSVALFFSCNTMLYHADKRIATEYFYLLFSTNFNQYHVSKLRHFSNEKNLPIEVYINSSFAQATKAFQLANLMINVYSRTFETVTFETGEVYYTLHFYVRNEHDNLLPLINFVNQLNRRIITHYNNEVAIEQEDVSAKHSLVKTTSKIENDYAINSISFASNNATLSAVLNEILYQLKITGIRFIKL